MKKKKSQKETKDLSGDSSTESYGQKHLIKCRCVLSQYKNLPNAVSHQFLVFSEIENGQVKQKYSQCNNCGLVHKVIDVCTSEIMQGKENMSSIISIDDIKNSINPNLIPVLERNNCELPTWEHVQYVIEKKRWGDIVVLSNDVEGDNKIVKYVRILGESLFKVDSHIRKESLGE
jgi:hypothetical protein